MTHGEVLRTMAEAFARVGLPSEELTLPARFRLLATAIRRQLDEVGGNTADLEDHAQTIVNGIIARRPLSASDLELAREAIAAGLGIEIVSLQPGRDRICQVTLRTR
jgi:hypothetical protein